jgi:hypothetical protein
MTAKKRNAQDATVRNVRAGKKRDRKRDKRVQKLADVVKLLKRELKALKKRIEQAV